MKCRLIDFAKVAGRIGVLTVGSTQFEILSSLFASMLGKAFFDTIHEGESITGILKEATIEGGGTGASLATIAILPFPFSIVGAVLLIALNLQV
ncbi:MAG: hypothetical protein ACE5KZ_03270 [Candidatus Scalinduaceae bacterium]